MTSVHRDRLAIEVKAATRWQDRDLSELRVFLQRTPRCRVAILVHSGSATVSLGDRQWGVPIPVLLN